MDGRGDNVWPGVKEEVMECEQINVIGKVQSQYIGVCRPDVKEELMDCVQTATENTQNQYTNVCRSNVKDGSLESVKINPNVLPISKNFQCQLRDDCMSVVKKEPKEWEDIIPDAPPYKDEIYNQNIYGGVKEEAVGVASTNKSDSSVRLNTLLCVKKERDENAETLQINSSINSGKTKTLPLTSDRSACKTVYTRPSQSETIETSTQPAVPVTLKVIYQPVQNKTVSQSKVKLILRHEPHQKSVEQRQGSIQSSPTIRPVQNLLEKSLVHSTSSTIPVRVGSKQIELDGTPICAPVQIPPGSVLQYSTSALSCAMPSETMSQRHEQKMIILHRNPGKSSQETHFKVAPKIESVSSLPYTVPVQAVPERTSTKLMTPEASVSLASQSNLTSANVIPQLMLAPRLSGTVQGMPLYRGTPGKAMPQLILVPTLSGTVQGTPLPRGTPGKAMPQLMLAPRLSGTVQGIPLPHGSPTTLSRTVKKSPMKVMPQLMPVPTLSQSVQGIPILPEKALEHRTLVNTVPQTFLNVTPQIKTDTVSVPTLSPGTLVKAMPQVMLPQTITKQVLSLGTSANTTPQINSDSGQTLSSRIPVSEMPQGESLSTLPQTDPAQETSSKEMPQEEVLNNTLPPPVPTTMPAMGHTNYDKCLMYACGLCTGNVRFSSMESLNQHIRNNHAPKNAEGFVCFLCGVTIERSRFGYQFSYLKYHQKQAHDQKHIVYGKWKESGSSRLFENCGILSGKIYVTDTEVNQMMDKAAKILNEIGLISEIENLRRDFYILNTMSYNTNLLNEQKKKAKPRKILPKLDQTEIDETELDKTDKQQNYVLLLKHHETKSKNRYPLILPKQHETDKQETDIVISKQHKNREHNAPMEENFVSCLNTKYVTKEEFQIIINKSYKDSFSSLMVGCGICAEKFSTYTFLDEHVSSYCVCMLCYSSIAEQEEKPLFNLTRHQHIEHGGKHLIYGNWKEYQSYLTSVHFGILRGKDHGSKREMNTMLARAVRILKKRGLVSEMENLKSEFSEIIKENDIQDPLICMHKMCGKEFSGENRRSLILGHLCEHWYSGQKKCHSEETKNNYVDELTRKLKTENKIDKDLGQQTESCNLCHRKMLKTENVRGHFLRRHISVQCNICKKIIVRKNMKRHMQTHNESETLQCDKCGLMFKNRRTYRYHKVRKANYVMCEICGKIVSVFYYKDHMRIHENRQLFKCTECGKRFNTSGDAKKHKQIVHVNIYQKCSLCGNSFKQKSLRNHMRYCYKIQSKKSSYMNYKFKCDICDKRYRIYSSLRKHLRNHFSGKSTNLDSVAQDGKTEKDCFVCSLCGATFNTHTNYTSHIQSHDDTCHCKICNKNFKSRRELHHYNAICHPTTVNRYTCTYCHKKFSYKSILRRHVQVTHLKHKIVRCTICNYKCNQSYMLKYHMFRHNK